MSINTQDYSINVTKRNGDSEKFNPEKIHRVVKWACEDISGVNVSDITMKANINFVDGISSREIHESLIDAASDLISEDTPNYAKVAARILSYQLRKDVWGGKDAPRLIDIIRDNVDTKFYSKELLELYSRDEILKLGGYVDHKRDDLFDYGGLVQLREKYLVCNRETKEVYETPQFAFMCIAMVVFQNEKENRLKWVKTCYDAISKFKINIPTPILAGARTNTKSYSSCCLMGVEDTKNSLFAANTTAGMVTCDKYGVGIDLGKIRPINSSIRNGETLHAGVIAWLKIFQATIQACMQGGSRRGAATITFPIFHPEIEDIIVLKNNQGTHENRVHHLDYSISISNLFYERFVQKGKISLFSSVDAPEVYESFGKKEFNDLYLKAEKNKKIPRKEIDAREFFSNLFTERLETGRIYVLNVDQANDHSPWKDKVSTSNLCQEILHPLKAEQVTNDPNAEIGVCILSATNMLNIKNDNEHKRICELMVRMLDNIIDIQKYRIKGCENFAKNKRSLGIGITNFAAWLASKGLNHNSKEALQITNDFMEKQQYYLLEASCDLAQERGAAKDFERTKYFNGETLSHEMYNKNVDELLKNPFNLDWEALRARIKEYGLRHCTLSAVMPVQSSSVVQNSTNGMEPLNSLVARKASLTKTAIQVAPGIQKWKNKYLLVKDIQNNDGIINITAVITKWLDMALSSNLYYDRSKYEGGNIPLSTLIKDHLKATKLGYKTFYYMNSAKVSDKIDEEVEEEEQGCVGGACSL